MLQRELNEKLLKEMMAKRKVVLTLHERFEKLDYAWSFGNDYKPFPIIDRITIERNYQSFKSEPASRFCVLSNGFTVDL